MSTPRAYQSTLLLYLCCPTIWIQHVSAARWTMERTYFRRKIIWGSAQGPRYVRTSLREPEIGYFDMTVVVEEDILRFEVAVDDVEGMEVIEGEGDLCRIEFCDRIREPLTKHVSRGDRQDKGDRHWTSSRG